MIYLYGAGGHAKVVADILESRGVTLGGFFDDQKGKKIWDYPEFVYPGPFVYAEDKMIISIGNNLLRKKIAGSIYVQYHSAIHPGSIVSLHSFIGAGSVVMGGTLINADTVIGSHCIINTHASIDHDCTLGDFVHVSPGATLCGGVSIGECSHIGAGAIIIPGIKIGSYSTVGAGAVVIRDIGDNEVAVGSPARIIKK